MSYEPPAPPASIPSSLLSSVNDLDPEDLRSLATYAEELADHQERAERLEEGGDESNESPDDLPDGVPSKATITIKEINDNRYYYYQWREGDTVTSKYKGPVDPDK